MTTKTLPQQARIVAGMISLGEHIAWGRDTDLLIQLADQVEALTKEGDALMSAAKLAFEALDSFAEWEDMGDPQRPATEAIAALRQAGVQ